MKSTNVLNLWGLLWRIHWQRHFKDFLATVFKSLKCHKFNHEEEGLAVIAAGEKSSSVEQYLSLRGRPQHPNLLQFHTKEH